MVDKYDPADYGQGYWLFYQSKVLEFSESTLLLIQKYIMRSSKLCLSPTYRHANEQITFTQCCAQLIL